MPKRNKYDRKKNLRTAATNDDNVAWRLERLADQERDTVLRDAIMNEVKVLRSNAKRIRKEATALQREPENS